MSRISRRGLQGFILLVLLGLIPEATAASWQKSYRKGDYTHAFQQLEKLAQLSPDLGNYNRGCTLYRQKKFQEAATLFAEAAEQTEQDSLKQKALYNQGTARLAETTMIDPAASSNSVLTLLSQSIELFEQSLEIKPDDLDAKQNLERAIHLMVTGRIRHASQKLQAGDQQLTEFKAKTAKENYTQAKDELIPLFNDFSPNNEEAFSLNNRADQQLQMLEEAIQLTKEEMEAAKQAIDHYRYKQAADLMRDDKPVRKWAFDLDEKLAQEFQQLIQNNQNIIEIVYPTNPLKP